MVIILTIYNFAALNLSDIENSPTLVQGEWSYTKYTQIIDC